MGAETIHFSEEERAEMLTASYAGKVSDVVECLDILYKVADRESVMQVLRDLDLVDEKARSCDVESQAEEAKMGLAAFIGYAVMQHMKYTRFLTPVQRAWIECEDVLAKHAPTDDSTLAERIAAVREAIKFGAIPHGEVKNLWEWCAAIGYTQRMEINEALRSMSEPMQMQFGLQRMRGDTKTKDEEEPETPECKPGEELFTVCLFGSVTTSITGELALTNRGADELSREGDSEILEALQTAGYRWDYTGDNVPDIDGGWIESADGRRVAEWNS